jgi:hypothetical protein
MAQQIQWGNATFILNHERFEQGCQHGRRYYFEDWPPEGHLTGQITVSEMLHLVAIPDEQGHYQLDDGRQSTVFREGVEELVGVLTDYMAGPLHPETPEEQRVRLADSIIVHDIVPVS